jgi:hypothetical protein
MQRIPAIRGSALKALHDKTKLQLEADLEVVVAPVIQEPVKVKADKPKKSKVKKSSVKKNAGTKETI